jgi:hypothetical protein
VPPGIGAGIVGGVGAGVVPGFSELELVLAVVVSVIGAGELLVWVLEWVQVVLLV